MRRMLLMIPLFAGLLAGQEPGSLSGQDRDLIRQLLARVEQLEAEVKELKSQRAGPPLAGAAVPAAPTAPGQPGVQAPPAPPAQIHEPAGAAFAGMQFRGFSDVQYQATDERGVPHSFGLGQFNLFITSKLSDSVSVLAETVLKASSSNQFRFELERLLFQYSANEYLNLAFGRYHTAIGWYNTAYHHSAWLQTATGRPFIFAFGGILPIHNVGVSATGRIPSGGLGLRYVAEIGNGQASRSRLDEPVQNVRDENNRKAVNFGVLARPDALRGFQAGFSVYRDRLRPEGLPGIGQTILAGHAIFQNSAFEWLNEALVIRNAVRSGRVLRSPAFYTQLSRRTHWGRPYFRYQYLNVPAGDPIHGDVGLLHGPSFGIRYDLGEFSALKLQYDRAERRALSGINTLTTQLSFTF